MNSFPRENNTFFEMIMCIALVIGLAMTVACGGGSSASAGPPAPAALMITTTSLPSGNVGADYLVSICSTGGANTDNWAASTGLPPGLTLMTGGGPSCAGTNSTGQLFGTPTTKGTFNFSVTVTDTAGATATKKLSVTIGAPLPLLVTTTSPLGSGQVNIAYGNSLLATGGVKPFKWTLAAGSLPSNLTLNTNGGMSGTPTEFGSFSFRVAVTDSETPAMTATANLNITIHTLLFGEYSFLFQGFDANGAVVAAGSFTADGLGGISGGLEDVNRHVAGPVTNAPVTGNYSIGLDNRGTLTLTSSAGVSTFAFALNQAGAVARFIEFDSSGTRGSGKLRSGFGPCPGFANPGANGVPYVFGASGDDLSNGRVAIAGSFQADAAGNLSGGVLDENVAGTLASNVSWTGTYAAPAGSSRCTMTLTAGSSTRDFAYYPPFLVEVDTLASGVPLAGGTVLQVAPDSNAPAGTLFTNASLTNPIVGSLSGYSPVTNAPHASLVFFSPDGNGNVTMTEDENNGGTVSLGTAFAGSYDVSATGRVTLTAGTNPPVLYLANPTEAFVLGTDSAAALGLLEPQISSGPGGTFIASITGNFHLGTESPAGPKVIDLAGVFDGTGALSGTWDESSQAGNVTDQAFTNTYSITNTPVNGSGTLTITPAGGQPANFVFLTLGADDCTHTHFNGHYTVCDSWTPPHATKLIAIPSDATQTNPAVLALEQ